MRRTLAVLWAVVLLSGYGDLTDGGGAAPDAGSAPSDQVTSGGDSGGGQGFVTVPDVVGKRLAVAKASLKARGLRVDVRYRSSSKGRGTVLSQRPRAGSDVREGRRVRLIVAKSSPPPQGGGGDGCTPGYSPCLPPASDYDCAGGSGDGPEYVYGTVTVTGSDPYGLDADNDGVGCE
jgi:hypothetical protein